MLDASLQKALRTYMLDFSLPNGLCMCCTILYKIIRVGLHKMVCMYAGAFFAICFSTYACLVLAKCLCNTTFISGVQKSIQSSPWHFSGIPSKKHKILWKPWKNPCRTSPWSGKFLGFSIVLLQSSLKSAVFPRFPSRFPHFPNFVH